ncbi:MAG: metallophosphoesterase [Paracoccaceae bacterium]
MRTYAIGDIHGHLDKLRQAHRLIEADRAACQDNEAPVVHVGDLVDRGPDSRGVVEFLLRGQLAGENWVVLKGNHDRMFRGFMTHPDYHDPRLRPELYWLHPRLGGDCTLASYGVRGMGERFLHDLHQDALAAVPIDHLGFVDQLPLYFIRGACLFVHAGIRPGRDIADQTEDDLLWIRSDFQTDHSDHGYLVVHGHTPVAEVTHYGNRLNIDTGAGYGKALSAVVIEGRRVFHLTDAGRVEITV